jgi:hypothetical protein
VNCIFVAFLIGSLLHMVEEYFYPGGFIDVMKRFNPRFAPYVTTSMAVVINGLQLLLCSIAIVVGRRVPIFGMSVAALLILNGFTHVAACVSTRRYVPGVATGLALYIPVSVYAYYLHIGSGIAVVGDLIISGALGLLYHVVPVVYLGVRSTRRRA